MKVSEIVTGRAITVRELDHVQDVAKIMRDNDVGFVPVVDGTGRLTGVVTDRDFTTRILARGLGYSRMFVREVMTTGPFVTCGLEDDITLAASRMSAGKTSRIVVTDGHEHPLAVISIADLAAREDAAAAARVLRAVAKREAPAH
ncbi:MAG TPA: CBS domain-containing protein [bacterium]|nr:CBS domain-containing protein [bacterium]